MIKTWMLAAMCAIALLYPFAAHAERYIKIYESDWADYYLDTQSVRQLGNGLVDYWIDMYAEFEGELGHFQSDCNRNRYRVYEYKNWDTDTIKPYKETDWIPQHEQDPDDIAIHKWMCRHYGK